MPDYFDNVNGELLLIAEEEALARIEQGAPIFRKRNSEEEEPYYVFKTAEEIAAQEELEKIARDNPPPPPPTGQEQLETFVNQNPVVKAYLRSLAG